jgi:tetratricopeptide (TPR) repeat protein
MTLANCDAALEIATAADLQWHIGPIRICRDMALACTGAYSAAWAGMNATLQRLESLKLFRYQLMACNMLGYLLLDLNLNGEAAAFFEQGLRIADRIRTDYWRPLLETNLAVARMRSGNRDVGADLERALALTENNREHWQTLPCLDALAQLCVLQSQFAACERVAERMLALAGAGAMREWMSRAQRWRGESYLGRRAFLEAAEALHEAAALAHAVGRIRLQWDVERALARLYHEQGLAEQSTPHEEAAMRLAERIALDLRGCGLVLQPSMP